MRPSDLSLPKLCGQLIVGGFPGTTLPDAYAEALRAGLRGGAILFRRNVPDLATTHALCCAIRDAAEPDLPPFIGVDQEGGRVARLPSPFPKLPPMRLLGELGDASFVRRVGRLLGERLAAIGFNLDFAPVLDVDSNPDNPIIGDRSFGREATRVAELAVAFGLGLEEASVLSCGKHFPGHGDTSVDSHVALPIVHHGMERLDAVELVPFRAAARAGLGTMMTAHVVVTSIDASVPATLSRAVCTDLLRSTVGFHGVLFSDDLEMAAVAAQYSVEASAVASIRAGCDVLLICSNMEWQERAHAALVAEAERDPAFRERCVESAGRALEARRKMPPRPVADAETLPALMGRAEWVALYDEIKRRAADLGGV
ncbi:beta-N-acetylhexosaminidase [Polyangium sp. y55x31]|uniref:beta-N-acetylhexosaminidase n=1 Tax=Polyangium sp. y55x31 TaxID=3042688 RepID=UPI0024829DE7|nr:beta-N-acetylhexosaminidase [Polyangium sp. y55x31]MDI1482365.1 beta-N-acetylhexosaminidase [Polyangium sp. y55x31]